MTPRGVEEGSRRSETWDVDFELDPRTGKYRAACPVCGVKVESATRLGIGAAICDHMNPHHGGRNQ